ncbi:MAG TPA: sugar phosphate isomerase/epimerase family protein [Burkholderiaceae bacterium]|nr:sugar phosphate isomerase/epimerase family protein [Burkholderiaceae bacterium]
MKIALCNEVIGALPFERQCAFAAAIGYDGLEIAPFTLSDTPDRLSDAEIEHHRRVAGEHGVAITSLHWLLVKPDGLSITSRDAQVRARTVAFMARLVEMAALLGARVLVHGSPKQRRVEAGDSVETALAHATDCWHQVAEVAARHGVVYCIEPLARSETLVLNTLADAAAIVDDIGSPGLRTMIDCGAASNTERDSPAALIDRWLPSGHIAHVQVNDRNRRGPGEGADRFLPVFTALARHGYQGTVAIEPFEYVPDGPATAARAIGYVRGVLEAVS